jgi:pregnancy-associated plasma protein-A
MKFRFSPLLAITLLLGSVTIASSQTSLDRAITFDDETFTGRTCGTPIPTLGETEAVQAQVDRWLRMNPQMQAVGGQIKVAFHVISGRNGEGDVPQSQVNAQIATLNATYQGTGYTFVLASTDRTSNRKWFGMTPQTGTETQAKNALAITPATRLNIYTCKPGQSLLGWAYFPNSFPETDNRHGVVVHYGSLPGGYLTAYNEGETVTHEVGHYLGLYHTFQGGCSAPGDYVDDTPFEASAYTGGQCSLQRDTCPSPGLDPISNYMDYSYDACLTNFTSGQDARMDAMVPVYRPSLLNAAAMAPELAAGGGAIAPARTDAGVVTFAGAVPNPSRGADASLVFSLPAQARVSLALYSVAGRQVAALIDETLDAGSRRVNLARQGLAPGTYFAVLTVDGDKISRTVILQ